MKVIFISNYFNHHQKYVSDSLYALCEGEYRFFATSEMREERKRLGYGQNELPSYVCRVYVGQESFAPYQKEIDEADVVLFGSAPYACIRNRIRAGKLVLRYSERPLKNGLEPLKFLPRLIKWNRQYPRSSNVYMLCASAYSAGDYAKFGLFRKRTYKWGYFPQTVSYESVMTLLKEKNPTRILWCGRFLDWKHPDDAIRVAARLRDEGYRFQMDFVGTGEMESAMRDMIRDNKLEECVYLLGSMRPEDVRAHMDKAGIYLFTSDRQEGWGAVLNESMNSGCAVVASDAIGAAPFLVDHGENGYLYPSGDVEALYRTVKGLLDDPQKQKELGKSAYRSITEEWNAKVATERVLCLSRAILAGEKSPQLYESGPCSRAK